ncbi:MAG: hypothetical protein GY859_43445 [Desulfobacterales bacterium]|nr:hypothetical protein [Desulfobacterales bacterium]
MRSSISMSRIYSGSISPPPRPGLKPGERQRGQKQCEAEKQDLLHFPPMRREEGRIVVEFAHCLFLK